MRFRLSMCVCVFCDFFSWCEALSFHLGPPDWPKVEDSGFNANSWNNTAQSERQASKIDPNENLRQSSCFKNIVLDHRRSFRSNKRINIKDLLKILFKMTSKWPRKPQKTCFHEKFQMCSESIWKVHEGSNTQKQWLWETSSLSENTKNTKHEN